MRKIVVALLALAAAAWAPIVAQACKGQEVLFEDDFSDPDPGWPQVEGYVSFVNGQLQLAFLQDEVFTVSNQSSLYDDIDLCVTTKHAKGDVNKSWAGLVFWMSDLKNHYILAVSPGGTWAVLRLQNGKWLFPISWRASPAIKLGQGAVNGLRVVTKGNTATMFINDTELGKIKGTPPQGGQIIGLAAEQVPGDTTVELFDDFKATQP